MKRLGLISLVSVLAIALVVGVFYGHFVERIIFVLNDDKDSMAENFRITDSKFNHHLIAKSSQPQPLPRKHRENVWPETFESHGEIINSDDFLKQVQTTGLVILENGNVIYEDYWHGLSAPQRQFAFSVAKSISSPGEITHYQKNPLVMATFGGLRLILTAESFMRQGYTGNTCL